MFSGPGHLGQVTWRCCFTGPPLT